MDLVSKEGMVVKMRKSLYIFLLTFLVLLPFGSVVARQTPVATTSHHQIAQSDDEAKIAVDDPVVTSNVHSGK